MNDYPTISGLHFDARSHVWRRVLPQRIGPCVTDLAPDLRCHWSASSSQQTTSQPIQNVTGAGSPSTQGSTSPVATGQGAATTGSGNKVVTGTSLDAAKLNSGSGNIVDLGNVSTLNLTDSGQVGDALKALSTALTSSNANLSSAIGSIGTVAPGASQVTTSGDAGTVTATASGSGSVTWVTLAAIATVAVALFTLFRRKKTA